MIIKSGFVQKLVPKGLNKVWKKIFIVCHTNVIELYNLNDYEKPTGTIPIEVITDIYIIDDILHIKNGNEENRIVKFKSDELQNWYNSINQARNLFEHIEQ